MGAASELRPYERPSLESPNLPSLRPSPDAVRSVANPGLEAPAQPESNTRAHDQDIMNDRVMRTQAGLRHPARRVVSWLADHPDDALDVARLADVACMSPFTSTASTTRCRVRPRPNGTPVAVAPRRGGLIARARPVTRIARRARYGSQQAFTRAFKAAYGVPPAHYRPRSCPVPSGRENQNDMETMVLPARRFGKSRHPCSGTRPLAAATRRSHRVSAALDDRGRTGGRFARPRACSASTTTIHRPRHHDALRSKACISVPDGWTPAGDVQLNEIRGGRDVVALHVGPYAELERPYTWLYGTWLPQSGEEAADAPCVEAYLNDARTVPPTELQDRDLAAARASLRSRPSASTTPPNCRLRFQIEAKS